MTELTELTVLKGIPSDRRQTPRVTVLAAVLVLAVQDQPLMTELKGIPSNWRQTPRATVLATTLAATLATVLVLAVLPRTRARAQVLAAL